MKSFSESNKLLWAIYKVTPLLRRRGSNVGFKNEQEERLIVLDYEEAVITEKDRASTKQEDRERCLKGGVLPIGYEGSILSLEVQQPNQLSCFIRNEDDTVTCPMGYKLTRVRTFKNGSARYQNRSACNQCPNRCTSGKNYKVVKLGLSFLAYNLRRAINMVGTKKLIAAMRA